MPVHASSRLLLVQFPSPNDIRQLVLSQLRDIAEVNFGIVSSLLVDSDLEYCPLLFVSPLPALDIFRTHAYQR